MARHYANCLITIKVLSGDGFIETTGSHLAYGGIAEVKNHLKQLDSSKDSSSAAKGKGRQDPENIRAPGKPRQKS